MPSLTSWSCQGARNEHLANAWKTPTLQRGENAAVIAESSLLGARPGEKPFLITVRIGMPYRFEQEAEAWACPVEVSPLLMDLRHIRGTDSLQALSLAICFARELLQSFREEGGLLLNSTGQEFSLAYFGIIEQ